MLQLMCGRDADAEQERRIISSLQSLKDAYAKCLLRPRIPRPFYPACRVRYVSRAFVEFESGQFMFKVPTKRVTDVVEAWRNLPAEVCIQGRIQWLSLTAQWQYFSEPPSPETPDLGVGIPIDPRGHVIKDLAEDLLKRGWEMTWAPLGKIEDYRRIRDDAGLFYNQDGHFYYSKSGYFCIRQPK